jgi:lipopolysaccharide export system protein LptA
MKREKEQRMRSTAVILAALCICTAYAEKVQVTSDSMKAMNLKKEIRFIGNAKVIQNGNMLRGDEIIVYFNENNETKRYEAVGHVTFKIEQKNASYKGNAEKAVYLPLKSRYLLKGKAVIDDLVNKRHLAGEEIILDMVTGNAEIKGNRKKPVKFIFDMEKKK